MSNFSGENLMKILKPIINVTPLIDVLLVLLIIFMIITPSKPTDFKTKVPQQAKDDSGDSNPLTLVVAVNSEKNLRLNKENYGNLNDTKNLVAELNSIFQEREKNGFRVENTNQVEKTVFLKAPRTLAYGEVIKLVDAVKIAGAEPISLQIDNLQ